MAEYHEAVYRHLVGWLAEQYRGGTQEKCRIAGICDERIDQSGRLLGEVRALAVSRPASNSEAK